MHFVTLYNTLTLTFKNTKNVKNMFVNTNNKYFHLNFKGLCVVD